VVEFAVTVAVTGTVAVASAISAVVGGGVCKIAVEFIPGLSSTTHMNAYVRIHTWSLAISFKVLVID